MGCFIIAWYVMTGVSFPVWSQLTGAEQQGQKRAEYREQEELDGGVRSEETGGAALHPPAVEVRPGVHVGTNWCGYLSP